MSERNPKLMLIDGNSITYRAFFALPPLSNSEGQFTNAVYGFTQMLLKMLQDVEPTHVAVAFDAGKATFRHGIYESYKGTRQKTPGELSEQFPLVKEVLEAFKIPVIEVPNYEADDIIGTLSKTAEMKELSTLLVSGDKDLLQLVSPTVHAALTKKGITEVDYYDPATVEARFGLKPVQVIDLKGLMGDTSDNIPGIPGVGEKTAIKLLQAHPTVEEVLAHIDELPGAKLQEKVRENQDLARLSKELATINREVPLSYTIDDLEYHGFDANRLRKVFQRLGFKSLIDKIPREIDSSTASESDAVGGEQKAIWTNAPVTRIDSRREWVELLSQIRDSVGIIPDYENPDYQLATLRGLGVSTIEHAYYVAFDGELDVTDLRDLWADEYEKVVFDLKALIVMLDGHGQSLHLEDGYFDVLIANYLLNPSEGELRLSDIIERELQVQFPDTTKNTTQGEREALLARKAMTLPVLKKHISGALTAQELDDLYQNIELPLTFVLARMEVLGFYINTEKLRDYGKSLQEKLEVLTQEIYQLAGLEFNINSPKQLGEVLFEKMGLPAQKKTKTGYSTSADVLEKLAPYSEVVQKILDFRQLGKLQSTYVEGLLKVVRPETGRVHTSFHQALTATGRLTSKEPNLQNIPIRTEEGRRLRAVFEPSYEDWVILASDYSQIELRILAHLSGDDTLIEAFRQGLDIHTRTAADVFEVTLDEVTSLMRRQAKAVNFGIVYGISDFGLSQNLNITRAQAGKFIRDYFDKFPGVERYMTDIVATARKQGYVTTLLNRRRYLQDIHSSNFNLRSFAERTAMNTPIQGTAADIIKLAMVRIDKELQKSDLQARMLLQVHDELIFECPKDEVEALQALVEENMENAVTLNVPLKVDVHVGPTWYEAK